MADIRLDPVTGDLDISSEAIVLVDSTEAIAQHLRIRLQFFLGEWFLDPDLGVPYFEQILVKAPSTNVVRRILREVVSETPGIDVVNDFAIDYTPAQRSLDVSFRATTVPEGEQIVFNEELRIG